jgi:beta-galactosidase
VYVDGKLVGTLDRRDAAPDGSLPPLQVDTTGSARLDILVANDGRINVEHGMIGEVKGITEAVLLDGHPLTNWQISPLPMAPALPQNQQASTLPGVKARASVKSCGFGYGNICPTYTPVVQTRPAPIPPTPAFFQATFNVATPGDTFLDFSHLGKGAIWINGHNLGRYWSVGPQQTLYVPGVWLKPGNNEIVVFDMLPKAVESVVGLDHPILNAPVRDQTTQTQQ